MEVTFHINKQAAYAKAVISGAYDFEAFKSIYQEFLAHPEFTPGLPMIWDIQELEVNNVTQQTLNMMGDFMVQLVSKRGESKAAFVVSSDLSYGLSRMFSMMNERSLSVLIMVFRDLAEAEEWIKSSPV